MEKSYLPDIASIPEACEWLLEQTGKRWTLARLLKHGLVPWFWLDYQTGWPDAIFNGRTEGFFAPLCFAGDTRRLAAGGDDVLVTMTRTAEGTLIKLGPPPVPTFSIDKLRFKSDEIKRLAEKCNPVPADVSDGTTKSLSGDDVEEQAPATVDHDETLAALFDPPPVKAVLSASVGKPPPKQQYQEQEILRVIRELSHDPKKLPKQKPGKSGVKAEVRQMLLFSVKVFDKAWERLRASQDIQGTE